MTDQSLSSSEESDGDWLSWTMEGDLLKKIPKAFSNTNVPDLYYAEGEISANEINLEVSGVGTLTLPLASDCIEKLIEKSSKAQFGLGSDTLLDLNVRDTHEIPAVDVQVNFNDITKNGILIKIRDSLGFGHAATLSMHLNKMLIYEPGHFFKMHQDSEKLQNMVASLVIVLPSAHSGGNLIIQHASKEHIFSTEHTMGNVVKWVAFYADCHHEVQEIKEGFRVALTYNLVLYSGNVSLNNLEINIELKDAIVAYFDEVPLSRKLRKVVYLLDHSYTEHSLRWNLLKGVDRERSLALLAVGKEFNIILYLVLVKIHRSWSTNGSRSDPVIEGLMGYDVSLSHWINTDNYKETIPICTAGYDEICWTTHTESFKPYKYNCVGGYIGNEGGTLDHWYRRAGIVFWPTSNKIPMNFILSHDNSMNKLRTITSEPGKENEAKEIVLSAGKYLYEKHNLKKDDFEVLTKIAIYTKDKDIAFSILSHSPWGIIEHIAEELVELQAQFGILWCLNLLSRLFLNERTVRHKMFARIDKIVRSFLNFRVPKQIIECLLDLQMGAIEYHKIYWHSKSPRKRHTHIYNRINPISEMLEASAAVKSISSLYKVIEHVISDQEIYPVLYLAEMYLICKKILPPDIIAHCESLKTYLESAIATELALGVRADDDWSIPVNLSCDCDYCKSTVDFMQSKTETEKVWITSSYYRRHIMNGLLDLDLPVEIIKVEPDKLTIVKKSYLHRDALERVNNLKLRQEELSSP